MNILIAAPKVLQALNIEPISPYLKVEIDTALINDTGDLVILLVDGRKIVESNWESMALKEDQLSQLSQVGSFPAANEPPPVTPEPRTSAGKNKKRRRKQNAT